MKSSKLLSLVLFLAFVSGASAWCAAWNEGGQLRICQGTDRKKPCEMVQSEDKCENLNNQENWGSGSAVDKEKECVIYSKHDCKGTFVSVDHVGWKEFPIKPKSFRCSCVSPKTT